MKPYTLRSAGQKDARFLFDLKTEAMKPVSAILKSGEIFNYDEEFKKYLEKFEPEKIQIIQFEEKDVGRLRVVRSPESIYIGGIQILPEFQNKGIGTAVMSDLIKESEKLELPITLEVHQVNLNAINFYNKLGFKECEKTTDKIVMICQP